MYGLTSANFPNPFKDDRNKDNIVAKRGALFMIDLKHMVQELGYQVIHMKTDSIKIPNADVKIIELIQQYGREFGYIFQHEVTYEKMALVNDAVFVSKNATAEACQELYGYVPEDNAEKPGKWNAVGAQFQHKYVFKTLFTQAPLEFNDYRETKSVKTALYLDFDDPEDDTPMAFSPTEEQLVGKIFIGKTGSFIPVSERGALLLREKNGDYYSATGAKGYKWLEADMVKTLGMQDKIDMSYYNGLVDKAIEKLTQFGDVEWLTA